MRAVVRVWRTPAVGAMPCVRANAMSPPAAPLASSRHSGCHALAVVGAGTGKPADGSAARPRNGQALCQLRCARRRTRPGSAGAWSGGAALLNLGSESPAPGAHCASADAAYTAAKSMPRRCSAAGRLMSSTQVAGLAAGRRARPAPPSSSSSSAPAPASAARSGSGGTPGIACAVVGQPFRSNPSTYEMRAGSIIAKHTQSHAPGRSEHA